MNVKNREKDPPPPAASIYVQAAANPLQEQMGVFRENSMLSLLSISQQDESALMIEKSNQLQLLENLQEGADFETAAETARKLDIDADTYQRLAALYAEYPPKEEEAMSNEFRLVFSGYAPQQRRVIRENILPRLKEEIIAGEMTDKNEIFRTSVGLKEADFHQLAEAYQTAGEEELDRLLEEEYSLFYYDVNLMRIYNPATLALPETPRVATPPGWNSSSVL